VTLACNNCRTLVAVKQSIPSLLYITCLETFNPWTRCYDEARPDGLIERVSKKLGAPNSSFISQVIDQTKTEQDRLSKPQASSNGGKDDL